MNDRYEINQKKTEIYSDPPLPEYDGFTPSQMFNIVYSPYDAACPIKLNSKIDKKWLENSPIFNILLAILDRIEGNWIKLTAIDNLPPKIVKDIYSYNYYPDEAIETKITILTTEKDWIILHSTKIVLIQAGILRKVHHKLMFTKQGKKYYKEGRFSDLFLMFLKAFTFKFNWAYNDGYENEQIGQLGFLYMLHLLNKYGKTFKPLKYYANLYFKAFPDFKHFEGSEDYYYDSNENAIYTRFFERFCNWFGFVDLQGSKYDVFLRKDRMVKSTVLLNQLIIS
jgi:hypothetical protein